MGQHVPILPPRHIDEAKVARDALVHRYANYSGITYGRAVDSTVHLTIESLRNVVEGLEGPRGGRRRGYAASQPTTTIQGIAR